jgi:cell division protein FtsB
MDLRDGLEAIEAKARNELGLIKEGETFFLLLED